MYKILFRTSGGRARKKQYGMGHVNRCINLAKNFKNYEINFLIEDYGGVNDFLKKNGIKNIFKVNTNLALSSDITSTKKIILEKKIDLVIVDKYNLKLSYCKEIRKIAKIVVLSDLFKIDFPVDLVINGFIGFKSNILKNKYNSRSLVGPKYQILKNDFAKKEKKKKKFELLVTFGGFDENKIIEKFLERISNLERKIKIKIILGPATVKSKKISKFQKKFRHNVTIKNQTSNMYNEIITAKFGLCAGGITTYEFAALKVPFAIISQVRHQLLTAKEWEKKKIAKNLGFIGKKTGKEIDMFLKDVEKNRNVNYKSLDIVDGLGSKRVVMEIKKILKDLL